MPLPPYIDRESDRGGCVTISNGFCRRPRCAGGADGWIAFHPGNLQASPHAFVTLHVVSEHSVRFGLRIWRNIRCMRSASVFSGATARRNQSGNTHPRGRDNGSARIGISATKRGQHHRAARRDQHLHLSTIRISCGRHVADEFSFAALNPAHARERVCRSRIYPRGLRRSNS